MESRLSPGKRKIASCTIHDATAQLFNTPASHLGRRVFFTANRIHLAKFLLAPWAYEEEPAKLIN